MAGTESPHTLFDWQIVHLAIGDLESAHIPIVDTYKLLNDYSVKYLDQNLKPTYYPKINELISKLYSLAATDETLKNKLDTIYNKIAELDTSNADVYVDFPVSDELTTAMSEVGATVVTDYQTGAVEIDGEYTEAWWEKLFQGGRVDFLLSIVATIVNAFVDVVYGLIGLLDSLVDGIVAMFGGVVSFFGSIFGCDMTGWNQGVMNFVGLDWVDGIRKAIDPTGFGGWLDKYSMLYNTKAEDAIIAFSEETCAALVAFCTPVGPLVYLVQGWGQGAEAHWQNGGSFWGGQLAGVAYGGIKTLLGKLMINQNLNYTQTLGKHVAKGSYSLGLMEVRALAFTLFDKAGAAFDRLITGGNGTPDPTVTDGTTGGNGQTEGGDGQTEGGDGDGSQGDGNGDSSGDGTQGDGENGNTGVGPSGGDIPGGNNNNGGGGNSNTGGGSGTPGGGVPGGAGAAGAGAVVAGTDTESDDKKEEDVKEEDAGDESEKENEDKEPENNELTHSDTTGWDRYQEALEERVSYLYKNDPEALVNQLKEYGYSEEQIEKIMSDEAIAKEAVFRQEHANRMEQMLEIHDKFANDPDALISQLKDYNYTDKEIEIIMKDEKLVREAVTNGELVNNFGIDSENFDRVIEINDMYYNDQDALKDLLKEYGYNDRQIEHLLEDREMMQEAVLAYEDQVKFEQTLDDLIKNPEDVETPEDKVEPSVTVNPDGSTTYSSGSGSSSEGSTLDELLQADGFGPSSDGVIHLGSSGGVNANDNVAGGSTLPDGTVVLGGTTGSDNGDLSGITANGEVVNGSHSVENATNGAVVNDNSENVVTDSNKTSTQQNEVPNNGGVTHLGSTGSNINNSQTTVGVNNGYQQKYGVDEDGNIIFM